MKVKICFVVSSEMTVKAFLADQISKASTRYDAYVAVNTKSAASLQTSVPKARIIPVKIIRKISPLQDLLAFIDLARLFRSYRFELIHSVTPKAGLLAMAAGLFSGIPVRMHTFTGQVWATSSGLSRVALKSMDRLLAFFATHILVDSFSQKDFLIKEGVVSGEKARVLLSGSISGVDTTRFRPDPFARDSVRNKHGIKEAELLLLFIGRLNRDKGVLDLADAFSEVCRHRSDVHLIVAGPDEENMKPAMLAACGEHAGKMHFVDFTHKPEQYMAAADIFCLPSYREGFGSVIIEAAAAGIPSIGTKIYGIIDAIEDGVTGLLVKTGEVKELSEKILKLLEDRSLRQKLGINARNRAVRDFSMEKVTTALLNYYDLLLHSNTTREKI